MATRRKKNTAPGAAKAARGDTISAISHRSRRKLWLFRLLALIGAPLLFVGLLELTLRLAGFGHSVTFLLPTAHQGRDVFVQNNQFAWRFFGPQMGRLPEPLFISRYKPTGTIRIFVFGESAAQGDPQPAFGPTRMHAQKVKSE